jgi:formylglycine-generating enzyme required for sulfatase activity
MGNESSRSKNLTRFLLAASTAITLSLCLLWTARELWPAPAQAVTNSIGMTLIPMRAGEFLMGLPASEPKPFDEEGPQHRVRITRPFYLGMTEVTQSQWAAIMPTTPWHGQYDVKEGPDYPATYVTWDDAVAFCRELSRREGKTYRLPTEAEWEYACRAGTETHFSFGDDASELGEFAWYDANTVHVGEGYAHRVGQKRANPLGLHDMHGNVFEWCSDWYAADYYAKSPPEDPDGASGGSARISRGGYWNGPPVFCRTTFRNHLAPANFHPGYGFRVLLER